MQIKDRLQLMTWLRGGASLASVMGASQYGMVENERFTPDARRAFKLLWTWSAPRFSGEAGLKQDRAYARLGSAGLARRMQRARQFAERLQH
jgi:hypothetical protein